MTLKEMQKTTAKNISPAQFRDEYSCNHGFCRNVEEAREKTTRKMEQFLGHMKKRMEEEIKRRFEDQDCVEVLRAFDGLNAGSAKYLQIETLSPLVQRFDFLSINEAILNAELSRAKQDFELGLPICANRNENIIKLLKVKNVFPVTSVTPERTFSAMNRVCSRLRSSLNDDRLSDLLVISLNRDIVENINEEVLVNEWAKLERRIPL